MKVKKSLQQQLLTWLIVFLEFIHQALFLSKQVFPSYWSLSTLIRDYVTQNQSISLTSFLEFLSPKASFIAQQFAF